jgi:hypothetical protein
MGLENFYEMDDSPEQVFSRDGFRASRTLKGPYAEAAIAAAELVGDETSATFPDQDNTQVLSVRVVPFTATKEEALITVEYGPREDEGDGTADGDPAPDDGGGGAGGSNPTDGSQVSERLEPTSEVLVIPRTVPQYWDVSQAEPLDSNGSDYIHIKGFDYIYERKRALVVPASVLDLVDCVNGGSLYASRIKMSFPKETLLYKGPTLSRSTALSAAGFVQNRWDIVHRFSYRKEGWNTVFDPDTLTFRAIYDGTGERRRRHPLVNFASIKG